MITLDLVRYDLPDKRISLYVRESDILAMSGPIYHTGQDEQYRELYLRGNTESFYLRDTKDNYDKVLKALNE